MSSKRRTKFTTTIYCGNCRTVGDYEFTRGTILHADDRYADSERRDGSPDGRSQTIRKNERYHGSLVACRFCNCHTALTIRTRAEPPTAEQTTKPTPIDRED